MVTALNDDGSGAGGNLVAREKFGGSGQLIELGGDGVDGAALLTIKGATVSTLPLTQGGLPERSLSAAALTRSGCSCR